MTTPTITPYPDTLPAKGQANAAFDVNVDDFLTWLTLTNGPELAAMITYTDNVAATVLATALAGNIPPLTGEALKLIRVNAAEDGAEFVDPPNGDFVGTTATQTLTNKTLTSPVVNVTSDASGDIYYRNASGEFVRLPIGATDEVLKVVAGLPAWVAGGGRFIPPSAIFTHVLADNTTGSAVGTSDTVLNHGTTVVNDIVGCSLSANKITLPAGDYYIDAMSNYTTGNDQAISIFLYSDTISADLLSGSTISGYFSSLSFNLTGKITLASTSVIWLGGKRTGGSGSTNNGATARGVTGRTNEANRLKIWEL
jgi:hypothetical protein